MKTKTTSTSRAATMASSAAAALLLFLLGSTSVISTVAADPNGVERLPPPYNLAPPGGGTTGLRSGSSASFEFGKVDVFIDLACPKSAEAWPSLKQVVEDQRQHAQFVFHVLPLSDDPIGFFAAKAVQVILANSGGTYDDVKYFIDWVFRGRDVVFFDGDAEMTLDARELITDWAVSSSSLSFTTFHSAMQDPAFDELVLEDLDDRFVLSVESTPTVLLNGIFMMHLDGYRGMLDFEFFLQSSGFPAFDDDPSSRSISSSSSGSSGSRSEMWEQMGEELRESYADMVQRQEEQQSQKQQREDSEERLYDSHSADNFEWRENASSSAHSTAFSPASTSSSSSSSSSFSSVIATSPSWGSFSVSISGTADSSSAWSAFKQSSSSASSQSSAAAASPSSASPPSWGWPTWPSFMTSLFKGRRDDQSPGGGWGWGVQSDNAPAVSAAALAAKAEAAVAAAAAQMVDTAAAKDPKITIKRGGHDDGIRGRAGLVAAAPAGVRVISGSELEKDEEDWWGEVYSGDDNAGPAAAPEEKVSDGPAAVREGEARGGEEGLDARSGEGDSDFKTGVVLVDAVAVKQ